jgi:hypothetical protein
MKILIQTLCITFAYCGFLQAASPEWKRLEDVFEPHAAVALETLDICLIGKIREIVLTDRFIFVLDEQSGVVYQFESNGTFIRILGSVGEGPGEYIRAQSIRRIYNDYIALYDSRTAQIKVYDQTGTFVKETPRRNQLKLFPRTAFLWPEPDYLILAGYNKYPRDTTWHLITNSTISQKIGAFGSYEPPEQGKAPMMFHSFIQVGDQIWTGSPYHHQIEIYDLKGKQLHVFKQPNPSAKIGDIYEKGYVIINGEKKKLSEWNPVPRNSRFATFGPYVFTRCAFVANIYQKDATHIKTVNGGAFHYLNREGAYAVTQAPDAPSQFQLSQMNSSQRIMLEDLGWATTDPEETNPYLVLWRTVSQ